MNRQEYLELRKKGAITNELLYEYYTVYNEKTIFNMTFSEFSDYIFQYVNCITNLDLNKVLERVHRYFENKFKIIKIIDKQNNVIFI